MSNQALLFRAVETDDFAAIDALIHDDPALLNPVNGGPPVTAARSVATAERLLSMGADPEAAARWWAPGFYTRSVAADVGRFLVEQGAALTVHAASGLGLVDRLAEMLAADPALLHAKGGDGCMPLHFARDVTVAKLLLDRGARVDARDEDHESTPAQWLIGDVPEVSRFLMEHGATPDIFLAAALGDRALAEKLTGQKPGCLAHRIGRAPEFPPLGHKGRGGSIYQWTLAFNSYAHQIALLKGHTAMFDFLYENSDTPTRLLVSCVLARRPQAEAIAAAHPGLVSALPAEDYKLLAQYCWETNTNYEAVRLMLDLGFPVAHPETSHGYSPLHNAAWAGSAQLVDLLIERGHPVDLVDPGYHATPLGFAIHDCIVEKRHPEGEFGRVVQALIDAGSPWDALQYPTGDARVDDVLKPRLLERVDGAALLGDEGALTRLLGPTPGPEELSQALAGAAQGGHVALCRRLLQAGASINSTVSPGRVTPLMRAAWSGSHETVTLLLEHGADVQAKNASGSTALDVAIEKGREEIVRLLQEFQRPS